MIRVLSREADRSMLGLHKEYIVSTRLHSNSIRAVVSLRFAFEAARGGYRRTSPWRWPDW